MNKPQTVEEVSREIVKILTDKPEGYELFIAKVEGLTPFLETWLREVVGQNEDSIPDKVIEEEISQNDNWSISFENDEITTRNKLRNQILTNAGLPVEREG